MWGDKGVRLKNTILGLALASCFILSAPALAQEELVAEPSSAVADEMTGVYRSRKFINLTLGIEHD